MSDGFLEIKCVFLGDSSVGKTCILNFFMSGSPLTNTTPTIGAAYVTKTIKIGKRSVDLMIWDTAGQEMYRGLAPMYYRNAKIAFLVFDLTSKKSLSAVTYWANELKVNGGEDIVLVVCGNKSDLDEAREVTEEMANKVSSELGAIYFETSAINGTGIERMFQQATQSAIQKRKEGETPNKEEMIVLDQSNNEKKGCC